ncbi:DNA replication and repair protein RecF [Spirochaetia bacterium]|nr:DNA replication and repair protein RecF [Spirochaetia bacterium]
MFSSLRVASFRNLVDEEIETAGKDVFLVGENGQGKTNFLEALYFCSYASSFRGVRDSELVRSGENGCSASVLLREPGGGETLHERLQVKYEGGKKTVTLDGKRVEDRKDLLNVAPCIVFCHEDMEFVSGSPERRRWFFDQSQSLYNPVYLDDLLKYRKVLKNRNLVLKDSRGNASAAGPLLDVLDHQMALYGMSLMQSRREAAERFSATFSPLYEEVSGIDGICVKYIPSWKDDNADAAAARLEQRREADCFAGTSLSGPHRDRYMYSRRGNEFSGKASTGQRRLLALLLRISQARRFSEVTGKNPVLLLDDVLLELDPEKRRRFLSVMPGYDQAFYTFLPEEPYERYSKADTLVYYMSGGRVTG